MSNVEKLSASNVQFAFTLFKEHAAEEPNNIFLSPFSINVALSMTYTGAKNVTAREMQEVLYVTTFDDLPELHTTFEQVLVNLQKRTGDSIRLHLGNRMYLQNQLTLLPPYQNALTKHFQSSVAFVDFGRSDAARQEINTWVEKRTQDKIKDLIGEGDVSCDTRLVLVNAIYFKGDWECKFDPSLTYEADFHSTPTDTLRVQMMTQTTRFPYCSDHGLKCSMLELPYAGKELSMLIVLPDQVDGIKNLEDRLDIDALQSLTKNLHERQVRVSLPKFRVESQMCLNDLLTKMGMVSLFNSEADLSGITGSTDLYVSAVIHKAFLEVNEEGSEAAAATAVVINTRCLILPPDFRVDHPFLVFIRDNASGIILFMGRVTQPQC